jgi:hypothetical protein
MVVLCVLFRWVRVAVSLPHAPADIFGEFFGWFLLEPQALHSHRVSGPADVN